MSERAPDNIVTELASILRELDEIKATQAVGNSQIVVKRLETQTITVATTPNAYNEYMTALASAHVTVSANDISGDNQLISYCVPYITYNGTVVPPAIEDTSGLSFNLWRSRTSTSSSNTYNVDITDLSLTGNALSSKSLSVKFYIWSCAKLAVSDIGGGHA